MADPEESGDVDARRRERSGEQRVDGDPATEESSGDGASVRDERGGRDGADERGDPPEVGCASEEQTEAQLRRRVEEKYDFDDFGPSDMAEMTPEEWDVAFDDETWLTGEELLDRVEAELKCRIADRDVFAVLEYARVDGERCLVAYSDSDYAIVYPNGSVEGSGTVVRDVKPTVALCSMEDYEVDEPPDDWALPGPEAVPESNSELGNWMVQLLAGAQLLIGLAAIVLWPVLGIRDQLIVGVVGLLFVVIGLVLFLLVANARLSERFRAQEYRDRLRSIETNSDDRPEFLPIDDDAFEGIDTRRRALDEDS